jgi:hypothetical protein
LKWKKCHNSFSQKTHLLSFRKDAIYTTTSSTCKIAAAYGKQRLGKFKAHCNMRHQEQQSDKSGEKKSSSWKYTKRKKRQGAKRKH